jgi:hypothetical protein
VSDGKPAEAANDNNQTSATVGNGGVLIGKSGTTTDDDKHPADIDRSQTKF